jgi:general secretion pathway protein J
MKHRVGRRRDAGFTLLEVVVALALAGLVSLILVEGMRLTTSGVERLSRRADRLDARQTVAALLRQALEAAVPIPEAGGEPGFVGKAESLSFVTVADEGGPGLFRMALSVVATDNGRDVILSRRLAVPFAEPRLQRSVLARGVRQFAITYYGATTNNDDPAWHDTWEGLTALPQLVRIVIDNGDDEVRFPLVVRLWNRG